MYKNFQAQNENKNKTDEEKMIEINRIYHT